MIGIADASLGPTSPHDRRGVSGKRVVEKDGRAARGVTDEAIWGASPEGTPWAVVELKAEATG
jgi:hypothetical protein